MSVPTSTHKKLIVLSGRLKVDVIDIFVLTFTIRNY